MEVIKAFEPIQIGNVKVPNRIVFAPINPNYADKEGFVTKRMINFYRDIAQGGVGLCVVAVAAVRKDSRVTSNHLII